MYQKYVLRKNSENKRTGIWCKFC